MASAGCLAQRLLGTAAVSVTFSSDVTTLLLRGHSGVVRQVDTQHHDQRPEFNPKPSWFFLFSCKLSKFFCI